jgi:hypothetical protein
MRTCIKCGDCKKDTCFYKRKDRVSGFFETCKDCYSVWRKEKYKNNIEKEKSYDLKRRGTIPRRYQTLKARAKKKKLELNISEQEFAKIVEAPCFYCANKLCKPSQAIGLDRIDSKSGYTIENVVSCCEFCNIVKMNNLTKEEMIIVAQTLINLRSA